MIKFYATIDSDSVRSFIPDVPIMLPASSWARYNFRKPNLPSHISDVAADCGGFVNMKKHGCYTYTPETYIEWLETFNPRWAAIFDFCCEEEVAGSEGIVVDRQMQGLRMIDYFWNNFRDCSWAWVPTIQGWKLEDYERHARMLKSRIEAMQLHYFKQGNNEFRVGIGTLCRRGAAKEIQSIVWAVRNVLPGVPLHLWGVKQTVLSSKDSLPEEVVSCDSAAWNGFFGRGIEERKQSEKSQRRFAFENKLPEYINKIKNALSKPKQMRFI